MYIFFSFLFGIKLSLLCGYLPSPPKSSAIPAPALPTQKSLPGEPANNAWPAAAPAQISIEAQDNK